VKKGASWDFSHSETQPEQHRDPDEMTDAYKPDISQLGVQDRHDCRGLQPGDQHHQGLDPWQEEDGR